MIDNELTNFLVYLMFRFSSGALLSEPGTPVTTNFAFGNLFPNTFFYEGNRSTLAYHAIIIVKYNLNSEITAINTFEAFLIAL